MRQLFNGTLSAKEDQALVEDMLFHSLPPENVADLVVRQLRNEKSMQRFMQAFREDGGRWQRVRATWHLAGSMEAVAAILESGICCDEAHCSCGRYGRGGYVASTAAKANAYGGSEEGELRQLFLVLALPDEEVVRGERGTRPPRTAADLPSHPTEYCFVDSARLHCTCLLTYRWVPTGRREKVTTAGTRVSHIVPRRASRAPTPLSIRPPPAEDVSVEVC